MYVSSLVRPFFDESLVCHFLLGELQRHPIALAGRGLKGLAQVIHLPLDLLDRMLMRFGAFGELDLQLIALGRGLLQPVSQLLKMGSTLLEELFEVLLRGEVLWTASSSLAASSSFCLTTSIRWRASVASVCAGDVASDPGDALKGTTFMNINPPLVMYRPVARPGTAPLHAMMGGASFSLYCLI